MAMKTQISYLSTARVLGILLVVLGHSYPFNVYIPKSLEFLRVFIYSFHMPLFVFLSGFLAAKSSRSPKTYIAVRAKKLLIPYFVLSLAAFLPKLLVQAYLNDAVSLSFAYLIRSELVPRENIWGHFWFLPVIFFLGVFSALMRTPLKKRSVQIPLLVCSYFLLWLPKTTDWFGLEDLRLNLFWFLLGYVLSGWNGFEHIIRKKVWLLGLPTALALLWLNISVTALIPLLMIGAILCLGTIVTLESKGLKTIEHYSFTIFLLSWPVQAVTEIILNKILHLPVWLCMIGMLTAGIAGPMLCVLLIRWIEKKIPVRWLKPVLGM